MKLPKKTGKDFSGDERLKFGEIRLEEMTFNELMEYFFRLLMFAEEHRN